MMSARLSKEHQVLAERIGRQLARLEIGGFSYNEYLEIVAFHFARHLGLPASGKKFAELWGAIEDEADRIAYDLQESDAIPVDQYSDGATPDDSLLRDMPYKEYVVQRESATGDQEVKVAARTTGESGRLADQIWGIRMHSCDAEFPGLPTFLRVVDNTTPEARP